MGGDEVGHCIRATRIAKGDLVLTMQAPGLDLLAAWLGLSWIGATAVPVNLKFRAAFLRDVRPTRALLRACPVARASR